MNTCKNSTPTDPKAISTSKCPDPSSGVDLRNGNRSRIRTDLGMLGILALNVALSNLGALEISGEIEAVSAPASVTAGSFDSSSIRFFAERDLALLESDVAVDMDALEGGGKLVSALSPGVIPAGNWVKTYFLHYDVMGQIRAGSVTFDAPVIGLIFTKATLDASDASLGSPTTIYPYGKVARYRGTTSRVVNEGQDRVELSRDRRTVTVQMHTGNQMDQVRILVAVPDGDGDGFPDELDECLDSVDVGDTIIVWDCDTGVENFMVSDGCTLSDLFLELAEEAGTAKEFVSEVEILTKNLVLLGALSREERAAILSCLK